MYLFFIVLHMARCCHLVNVKTTQRAIPLSNSLFVAKSCADRLQLEYKYK